MSTMDNLICADSMELFQMFETFKNNLIFNLSKERMPQEIDAFQLKEGLIINQ